MFEQPRNTLTTPSQSLSRTEDITLSIASQPSFRAAHEELSEMFGLDIAPINAADGDADGWNLNLGFDDIEPSLEKGRNAPVDQSEESLEVEVGRDAAAPIPFSPVTRESLSLDLSELYVGVCICFMWFSFLRITFGTRCQSVEVAW
jgi:hypothetical protein